MKSFIPIARTFQNTRIKGINFRFVMDERTLLFEISEPEMDLGHEISRYFGRVYGVAIIKDDFVCRRSSLKVCGDFGADKKEGEY